MIEIKLDEIIAPAFYKVHRAIKRGKAVHYKLKGGRGSTKSSFASVEIVLGIMNDVNANAVVLRKIEADLAGSVAEQIQWAINALGVSDYWRLYKAPLKAVYLPTGQRIIYRGADDVKKIKSTKFSKGYAKFVWYEELDEFSPEEIRSINQSLLRGGDVFTVLYTYNPPASVQSWVNIDAQMDKPNTMNHHSTYLDVPREWLGDVFFAEAEHLERVKPETYRHEYLGEITGTGGEIFRNIVSQQLTDEEIANFDQIRRGLDFGYAIDPLHYSECHFDKTRRKLYIFREVHQVGMKNADAVAEIQKTATGNAIIIADSAEPRTINEFRELGLYGIRGAKKGADSVEHGVKFMQDLEQIIIDPVRCPNTFREFCGYELEKDRNGNFKTRYPDKNNHSIDSVRYGLNDDITTQQIRFY